MPSRTFAAAAAAASKSQSQVLVGVTAFRRQADGSDAARIREFSSNVMCQKGLSALGLDDEADTAGQR
jgi:hypothetical protein